MKKTRVIVGILIFIALIFVTLIVLKRMGILVIGGEVDKEYYTVRGITVSERNGEVDWATVANVEKISYAFVRATSGSIEKDSQFVKNFNGAVKNKVIVGPYHEFKLESGGVTQATHYASCYKSKVEAVLPPTVKVFMEEGLNSDEITKLKTELKAFMKEIYNKYDKAPLLYVDNMTYQEYLRDDNDLDIYPICIENTVYQPMIIDDREWSFWQYDQECSVQGVKTEVAKSVFYSTPKDFSYFYKGDFLSQQREFNEREKEAQKK